MNSSTCLAVCAVLFPVALMLQRLLDVKYAGLTIYITDPFFCIAAALSFAYLSLRKQHVKLDAAILFLLLLAIFQSISVIQSATSIVPLTRMGVQYATFILLAYGGSRALSWSAQENIFYYGLLYVPLSVFVEAFFYLAGRPVGPLWFGNFEGSNRFVGITGDTAQASMLCLLLSCIALYRIFLPNRVGAWRDWLILLLSVLGNLLTGTRASLFCLPVALAFFYIDRFGARLNRRFILPMAAALVVAILTCLRYAEFLFPFFRLSPGDDSMLFMRLVPMGQALARAGDNLWFGVGFGNSFFSLRADEASQGTPSLGFVGSFNQYLQSLLESGLPGLLLTVCFLAALLLALKRRTLPMESTGVSRGAFLWAMVVVLTYQTETWISPGSRISAVFFAVTASVLRQSRTIRWCAAGHRMLRPW